MDDLLLAPPCADCADADGLLLAPPCADCADADGLLLAPPCADCAGADGFLLASPCADCADIDGLLLASPCAAALCFCCFAAIKSDCSLAVRFVVFGRAVPLAEGSGCPVNVKSYDGPSCDDVDPGDGGSYDDAFAQSIEKSRSDVK